MLGVGLTARSLHRLTHKRIEGLLLSGLELFDHLGIVSEHFVNHRLNSRAVGNLLQPLFFDEFVNRFRRTFPNERENALGSLAIDRTVR